MKIRVKVTPKSKREAVTSNGDIFLVRVKEPAREGKANQAVIRVLAEYFGITKNKVTIVGGLTSRNKVIEILK